MSRLTFEETAKWLLERDRFLILTHVRPDGDTVGCAAGLWPRQKTFPPISVT